MGNILSRLGILFGTRIRDRQSNLIPIHHKCRNCGQVCDRNVSTVACAYANFTRTGTKDQPLIVRPIIPDNRVRWSTTFRYDPIEFTSQKILKSDKEYVDRDPRSNPDANIPWNTNDRLCDRRSYHGEYQIVGLLPQNPCGRTGITGRGHLGHFGPNHAADPIVTRWKRNSDGGKVFHSVTQKPILEFVCIRRRDTGECAIPGGMVDRQERVTETLQREFLEEALNLENFGQMTKDQLFTTVKDIFAQGGTQIYCGYVDDPRNTDNAWMETTAYNFHDESNEHLAKLHVRAGDDATYAFWHEVDSRIPLFASHASFLKKVTDIHRAHW